MVVSLSVFRDLVIVGGYLCCICMVGNKNPIVVQKKMFVAIKDLAMANLCLLKIHSI